MMMNLIFLFNLIIYFAVNPIVRSFLSINSFKRYIVISSMVQLILTFIAVRLTANADYLLPWFPIDFNNFANIHFSFGWSGFYLYFVAKLLFIYSYLIDGAESGFKNNYSLYMGLFFTSCYATDIFFFASVYVTYSALYSRKNILEDNSSRGLLKEFTINLLLILLVVFVIKKSGTSSFEFLTDTSIFKEVFRYLIFLMLFYKAIGSTYTRNMQVSTRLENWNMNIYNTLYIMLFSIKSNMFKGNIDQEFIVIFAILLCVFSFIVLFSKDGLVKIKANKIVLVMTLIAQTMINKNHYTFQLALLLIIIYQMIEIFMFEKQLENNYFIIKKDIDLSKHELLLLQSSICAFVILTSILVGFNENFQNQLGREGHVFALQGASLLGVLTVFISISSILHFKAQSKSKNDKGKELSWIYLSVFVFILSIVFMRTSGKELYFIQRYFGSEDYRIDNILVLMVLISAIYVGIVYLYQKNHIKYLKKINLNKSSRIKKISLLEAPIGVILKGIYLIDLVVVTTGRVIGFAYANLGHVFLKTQKQEQTYNLFLISVGTIIFIILGMFL